MSNLARLYEEPPVPKDAFSPIAVTDPRIRKQLQLAGLRFAYTRSRWFQDEISRIAVAFKAGELTSDQVDWKLAELGALDLVYPELMVGQ